MTCNSWEDSVALFWELRAKDPVVLAAHAWSEASVILNRERERERVVAQMPQILTVLYQDTDHLE